jgi:hypothetical protein
VSACPAPTQHASPPQPSIDRASTSHRPSTYHQASKGFMAMSVNSTSVIRQSTGQGPACIQHACSTHRQGVFTYPE